MNERMTIECACERGGNCTSISACSADSILEDQADSYEARIADLQATIEQFERFLTSHIHLDDGEIFIRIRRDQYIEALGEKPGGGDGDG